MAHQDLAERQKVERDFWQQSATEGPDSDLLDNFLQKAGDVRVLLDLVRIYRPAFESAQAILELGGGQGWGACIVKRLFPQARVITSDISEHAVASVWKWEHLCQVKLDGALARRSYDLQQPDGSIDLVFCFAAAHHFGAHRRTLREIRRVLRPEGKCLYLYEPSCPRYLHALAHRRVNRIRPNVPEDVLVSSKIRDLAAEVGLECTIHFHPSVVNRALVPTLYYSVLAGLPLLQRLLPCTTNYEFTKG